VLTQFVHTYQEVSPRATGCKILGRGILPGQQHLHWIPGSRPRAKLELFDASKYTTLTGHGLPGAPTAVRDAQAALDRLYAELFPEVDAAGNAAPGEAGAPVGEDEALLECARQTRTGAAFGRLFDGGDLRDYNGDVRRGETALLRLLAVWCGPDRARLDRLFRRSALMREAWDRRRDPGGPTYGEGVIAVQLAGRGIDEPCGSP
jgi:primase-polymerase (primpol)-like protein